EHFLGKWTQRSPLTYPLPLKGERVAKGWRGEAEPYPFDACQASTGRLARTCQWHVRLASKGEGVAVPLKVKMLQGTIGEADEGHQSNVVAGRERYVCDI